MRARDPLVSGVKRTRLRDLHRLSVKRTLLLALVPAILLLMAGELWVTYQTAVGAANAAFDRSLFGAIKAIDANVSTRSGGIGVELPYRMLEFFQLTASGEVYYRVATEDGLAEIGSADLPRAPLPLRTGVPQFFDAVYFGERVRVGSYARPLARDSGVPAPQRPVTSQRIVIQVAEGVSSRVDFARRMLLDALSRDLLLLAVAAGLLAAALAWALRPLQRLRDEIGARDPQDLAPIDAGEVPADVRPLIEAINHHVRRNRQLVEERRRFIDDASHQLRTPLATLSTQLAFALRETEPARMRDALRALKAQLDETVRRTQQMLSLARADALEIEPEAIDANAFAEDLARPWWNAARDRGVDLGFEPADGTPRVLGHAGLLAEAMTNLLHNALAYTPAGGRVTVLVRADAGEVALHVIDDGPGIPAAERARAGERFFRASNVVGTGSGLGLAIVRSVAARMGGTLRVAEGADGRGCDAAIVLPRAGPDRDAGRPQRDAQGRLKAG